MKTPLIYKTEITFFSLFFLILLVVTFLPPIILSICDTSIIYDKVKFINKWIELLAGGLIVALIFSFVTLILRRYETNRKDNNSINRIIFIMQSTREILHNNKYQEKNIGLLKFSMIRPLISIISDDFKRIEIENLILHYYITIRKNLKGLSSITHDYGYIVGVIDEIVEGIIKVRGINNVY